MILLWTTHTPPKGHMFRSVFKFTRWWDNPSGHTATPTSPGGLTGSRWPWREQDSHCVGDSPQSHIHACVCNATPPNQNHSPLTHQTPVRTLPGQHVSCQVIKMVFPQTKTSPPSLTTHLLEHCQDNMCPVK